METRLLPRAALWLSAVALASGALAAADVTRSHSVTGVIEGAHGPPSVAWEERGGAIANAYVVRAATGADIYAWRLGDQPADSKWPMDGLVVCSAPGDQITPVAVSDGEGGFILAWQDFRNATDGDLYAQHILSSGIVDPQWPHDGALVCGAIGAQDRAQLVSDYQGGAFVVWEDLRGDDYDVYVQHLLGTGRADPNWPSGGRPVVEKPAVRTSPISVSDGSGGAILAWQQLGAESGYDIYAQHVLRTGEQDSAWPEAGWAISKGPGDQIEPVGVADGTGGILIAWTDLRDLERPRLYVYEVQVSGLADGRWPAGGKPLLATAGSQRQPALISDSTGGAFVAWEDCRDNACERIFLQHISASGAIDPGWPKEGLAVSTAKGGQVTPRVVGVGRDLIVGWLDRTQPANVHVFAQHVLRDGLVDPAWPKEGATLSQTGVEDLALASLEAGSAIALWRDPVSWDMRSARLTSDPPRLLPGPETPAITALLAPRPNPAHGTIFFRFTLARKQLVRLSVYDVTGRRVFAPPDRTLDAGVHELTWSPGDARNIGAQSGFYFVSFEADGRKFTRRFALLR